MLQAHNAVRANAMPVPSPALPPLTWNTSAQATATSWANGCTFAHNPNRGMLGENIYASAGATTNTASVQSWASEAQDYTLATNTCRAGQVCGHYTQLVWRSTTSVGCARRTCTTNSPFGASFPTWNLVVCNYAPPGNWNGQRPY